MKSLTEQLGSARRELTYRRRVYPGWVQARKMTIEKAEHEIECMEAIIGTLEKAVTLEDLSNEILSQTKPNEQTSSVPINRGNPPSPTYNGGSIHAGGDDKPIRGRVGDTATSGQAATATQAAFNL